jgi:hypothetical protein
MSLTGAVLDGKRLNPFCLCFSLAKLSRKQWGILVAYRGHSFELKKKKRVGNSRDPRANK